jgi:hypothetical protein
MLEQRVDFSELTYSPDGQLASTALFETGRAAALSVVLSTETIDTRNRW